MSELSYDYQIYESPNYYEIIEGEKFKMAIKYSLKKNLTVWRSLSVLKSNIIFPFQYLKI